MSGYLPVIRPMAASHTCAVMLGVSKTRNVICFLPLAVPPPDPSWTEHPVTAARAISADDARAMIRLTRVLFSPKRGYVRPLSRRGPRSSQEILCLHKLVGPLIL